MEDPADNKRKAHWLKQLDWVQTFSEGSKWHRLASRPKEYLSAIFYRKLLYPVKKKPTNVKRLTFFGKEISIPLPVSTDIYLAGAKTHDSEIRLARYLIRHLRTNQQYIDIGAHIGFFSMLAAELTGTNGKIISVEPSATIYEYLKANVSSYTQAKPIQALVSQQSGLTSFYEFDTLYSEFNTLLPDQYDKTDWYASRAPEKTSREAYTIEDLCRKFDMKPDIIKIDVEGAEYQVVSTLKDTSVCPVIIMEYILQEDKDMTHNLALEHLKSIGYEVKRIDSNGDLVPGDYFREVMKSKGTNSDNIVFVR
jgi:FkbM family methyltransferase